MSELAKMGILSHAVTAAAARFAAVEEVRIQLLELTPA
jgi:hypothetical protein